MLLLIDTYKEYLQLDKANTDINVRLAGLINSVEAHVQRFLQRTLTKQDYIELYDGNDTDILLLDQYPINSISKIEEWDGTDFCELQLDVDFERQVIIRDSNELYLEGYLFDAGIQNYRIIYNAGYEVETNESSLGNIPGDIKLALQKLSKIYYDEAGFGDSRLGLLSKTKGVQGGSSSWTFDTEATQKVLKEIEGYSQINVGNFR